jgi:hypothetical protein
MTESDRRIASRRPRRVLAIAVLAVAALAVAPAAAQQSSSTVLSEALFQEGKRLMAAGNFEAACPKLEESQRLDPGAGTLTALALCHRSQGKTASAWSEFKEVISLARRDGRRDREQVAQENLAELEPKLSRLKLDVGPGVLAQKVEVRLDGTVVNKAAFGQSVPADPGPHQVEARALGKKPFAATVTVGPESDEETVRVPMLEEDEHPPASAVARSPSAEPSSARRTAGYAVAGLGVVAVAVGGIFGFQAISKESDSDALCGSPCASAEGLQDNSDARKLATMSNVFIGAGLVAIAGGLVLVFTSPSRPRNAATLFRPLTF